MKWITFVLVMVICILMVICYALLVVASDADDEAEKQYQEYLRYKERKDDDTN